MTPKISDFVIQYQDSEGLRRSIPYAAELLAKERKETECELQLFRSANHILPFGKVLAAIETDLHKIEQAETILANIARRA